MQQNINLVNDLNEQLKKSPKSFLDSFGGLHDSKVENIFLDTLSSTLTIKVDDFYANFLDLPEYKNLKHVNVNITYSQLEVNIETTDSHLTIYEININNSEINISFAPSGHIKIMFESMSLTMG